MKVISIIASELRTTFFGSTEKGLSTISFIQGSVGLILSIIIYFQPTPLPWYIITRDLSLVLILVWVIVILFLKNYKKNGLLTQARRLLTEQIIASQQSNSKNKDIFFENIRPTLYQNDNSAHQIDEVTKKYANKICHSVLSDTRELFQQHFNAKGYEIGEDISLTVKLILTYEDAQEIENTTNDLKAVMLSKNNTYLATYYRDPHTWEKKPERKEINGYTYKADGNTAFDAILNKHEEKFFSNDLSKLSREGNYMNENPNWQKFYNSTLVVPISYRHSNNNRKYSYYGTLCVDSLNHHNDNLFDNPVAFHLLVDAADKLAMMFGHLDILKCIIRS